MTGALWFPPYTLDNPGTTISPYDYTNNLEVPRAMGGTCYAMGLMLAYNQFSGNAALQTYNPSPAPTGDAGGLGRKGAQKLVIFETDGLPNTTASAAFTNAGAYQSCYNIRYNSSTPSASEFPSAVNMLANNSSTVTSQINSVVSQIAAADSASPPGYSTARKPALVHCIAFGPVFNASSPSSASGLATLQQMQYLGNTQSSATTALPAYKIITGSDSTAIANLRTAIGIIMQNSIPVSLVR
jgi:hypothetical protein